MGTGIHQFQDDQFGNPGGGGGGAPADAQYLVLAPDAALSDERDFTPTSGLFFTDGGPGGLYTLQNTLVIGLAGGQTVIGGTAASENLTLQSTANAARGFILAADQLRTTATTTLAAIRFGSFAGDPSTLANGDTWYNSTTNKFRARENGVTVDMIGGAGAGPWVDDGTVVRLSDATDDVAIGTATSIGKFAVVGDTIGETTVVFRTAAAQTANVFELQTSTPTIRYAVNSRMDITSTPGAASSGVPTHFTLTGAAHTNLTLSTEAIDVNFNLSRIVQHATGALATQRAVVIQPPTYSFVGASVLTTAATVAISGSPVAGTNATITNSFAFWVQAGRTLLGDDVLVSGAPATSFARVGIVNIDPGTVGLEVRGAVLQTADLFRLTTDVPATLFAVNSRGDLVMTPSLATSGTPTHFLLTGAAHTTLAAATEAIDVNLNLARTVQFATGAIATQRAMFIQNPTYAFVGASTITVAATLALRGSPALGANATITTALAFWVSDSGHGSFNAYFGPTPSMGGGVGVLGLANAGTTPAGTPTGGGVLFSSGGALHWKGSAGTDTIIGPA